MLDGSSSFEEYYNVIVPEFAGAVISYDQANACITSLPVGEHTIEVHTNGEEDCISYFEINIETDESGYPGCTNPEACNYDSPASCFGGDCIMPQCTDPEAINYSPDPVCLGECIYDGDIVEDGVINTDDLLFLLGNLGCEGPDCPGDLNGDWIVNIEDILLLMLQFGG